MAEIEEEVEVMWKRGRTLGKGGFGFVSLASTDDTNFDAGTVHHTLIPSLIAVKSCMLSRSESLQVEREFLRMFEDSPHVIRSFGVKVTLEDGVLLYNLLLEYASGGSLADRLNCSGKGMAEVEVKTHTKNVVLGLSRIHGAGIIHCDLKPHNILLVTPTPTDDDTTEIAKIADFGLAMTLEQSWTQKQGLRGTKRYMAPESVLKQEYGPEVDIWALGCTVYELITGKPLWESSNSKVDDVLRRIASEEPSFENAKLSAEAKDFVRSCLVKNPSSRWTADMLLNHSFLKSANNVQPATKTRKKLSGYMSLLRRPRRKTAFKTQPHIRDLIVEH
ncbi:PREDICTED: mitogen-activated protein kinase kinase kinase ANP1-like [Nicotiana attenuata]|uniref:Mitogen-activated protein kinase kinase kinase anp1 n=1 Tax=Nicotiana attenuata TaxID=49451 RepID=A0A1J6JXZ3_NICAT|nr:PREDICTED: mitogen-activated protein kinase kinase kinase ANP1-like [Nicotiana attenuata]OIT22642.1 mitogen-activated protein kinase kinase kinase anp1 [Nicotiana attenuata]